MPSGAENLSAIIAATRKLASGLDAAHKPRVEALLPTLEKLQGKFFFKTLPSVPATNALLKSLADCQALVDKGQSKELPGALERLEKGVADLEYKATMPGTQLT